MISNLETAVANFLTTELAADATLSAVTYEVRGATSRDPLGGDRIAVVVGMEGIERRITILADGVAEIVVYAPMNVDGVTVAHQKLVEAAVERAFDATVNTDALSTINAAIAAATGWTGAGYHVHGWQQGREETSFIPSFRVLVGAVKS